MDISVEDATRVFEGFRWINNAVPRIMSVAEASKLSPDPTCYFMLIHWWGSEDKPLPAGFTRFTLMNIVGENANIVVHADPASYELVCSTSTPILVFYHNTN
jgi:hypothetical protein